jgi:ferric-dicitrate binding protein FerR (iron transport regulator)
MNETLHTKSSDENDFKRFTNEQKIMHRTAEYAPPFTTSKEEARQRLQAKIEMMEATTKQKQPILLHRRYWIGAAAAAIALLLVGSWFFIRQNATTQLLTAKSEHLDIKLPDGSEVNLNAESKLSYSTNNFNKNRQLTLEGEAFFQVKKGKKFVIKTQLAEVKILGTSLNVYARENLCKVSCVTGRVMVSLGEKSVIILPGESAKVENNKLSKYSDSSIKMIGNWRYGEFYFENASLSNVFKEMERQFNTTFVTPNIEGKYFTGSFDSKNLENALDIVCIPMGLTYDINAAKEVHIINQKVH